MSKTSTNVCGTLHEKEVVWSAVRHHTEEKFFPHPRREDDTRFGSQFDATLQVKVIRTLSSICGQIQTLASPDRISRSNHDSGWDIAACCCLKDVSLSPFL